MRPGAFPDHSAAGNHRQTAENQQDETDVWDAAGKVASKDGEDEDYTTKGELEEDRFQCGISRSIF